LSYGSHIDNEVSGMSQDDISNEDEHEQPDALSEDVKAIIDEIDEVLEENAEEFVRSYVRKGGQGWSGFFTPEFYVGAAAAGILSGATYDIFKDVIRRITKALLQITGCSYPTPEQYDRSLVEEESTMLKEAWKTAYRLAHQQDVQHTIDEATALHWALYTMELERSLGSVHIGAERYKRLANASAARRERPTASQLASMIIDEWLGKKNTSR
jgi:prokaryotic ubiquitin-like protein Pup